MRLIDADALIELLAIAIITMEGMAKSIGAEDDPEIKMEVKAYTDILEGVKEQPTIEPERKPGKWIIYTVSMFDGEDCKCSECGQTSCAPYWNFCPNCGAKMEGVRSDGAD